MIKLTNASTDPEAMMVEFADAAIALPAVPTSEGLHYLASFTEASLWQLNLVHCIKHDKKWKKLEKLICVANDKKSDGTGVWAQVSRATIWGPNH